MKNGTRLGIEIGGTKLQLGLGNNHGVIFALERGAVEPAQGAAGILDWIEAAVPRFVETHGAQHGPPSAVGIGFGGPVDSATGRVLTSHQIEGWEGVELKSRFEAALGLPATVANDANAAGWAEYCCGAGKGTRNFCYMNIGSGIGGALILDGALYDGQGQGAGEIGHTYVADWTAAAGAVDKLEHLCSGWSIEKRVRRTAALAAGTPLHSLCGGQASKITCALLAEAARQGDPCALTEIDRVAAAIAVALSNVLALFHPERIALGGGVSLMGGVLLDPLRRCVEERVFGPFQGHYEIVPCALEEAVVVVGALLLAGA